MNNNLFEGSDDDGEDLQLSTNKDYAKTYNILRKKELLQKCKLKNRVLRSFAISHLYHLIFLR